MAKGTLQNKSFRINVIIKIEKMTKIRPGMADIQAKMCGFPFPWLCSYSHGPQLTPATLPQ
jgi:hypothetical protein